MKTLALASIVALAAAAAQVQAAGFTENFEGAPPAGYTRTTGAETGGTTSIVNVGGTHGNVVQIQMPDVDSGYGRVTLNAPTNQPIGKLRDVSASFETYIDPSSAYSYATPYVLLGLDNNKDGQYDFNTETLVIQFTSSLPSPAATGTWMTESLTSANGVHVQVDRGLLPADGDDDFQPDESPDTLAELYNLNYNATTLWGDLNVFRVRVAAGFFAAGPGDQSYTALVDNLNVSVAAVPEPSTLAAVAGVAVLLLGRRRRRTA